MTNNLPLNGVKTHPLSKHALQELQRIKHEVRWPRQEVNPGVCNRLLRENLVTSVEHTSPYKAHKGGKCEHFMITEAGLAELAKHGLR